MNSYSQHSIKQRATLHPLLRNILDEVLITDDLRIDQGGRTDEEQWAVFNSGASTLHPPDGQHLIREVEYNGEIISCSLAADICPYINGKRLATDAENFGPYQMSQFTWFLRKVKEVGDRLLEGTGYKIRFGIDWDGDNEILTDQSFQDFFHVELIKV